jgi:serine/threonine-protein phosphatase 5
VWLIRFDPIYPAVAMSAIVDGAPNGNNSTLIIIDEASIARSNDLKQRGNALFAEKKYVDALAQYTAAVDTHPTAVLYANRAYAYLKLEEFGSAILDAEQAIALDPAYVKGYYRRGSAYMVLCKTKEAKKDFKYVVTHFPGDVSAKKNLAECEKKLRAEMFAKAIESDDDPTRAPKSYDVDSIVVDAAYSGPRLPEDGTVTRAFVLEMMEAFKAQQPVHKKYVMQMLIQLRTMLAALPSLVKLRLPLKTKDSEESFDPCFTVCGDTHGQFYDLCNIFELGGLPSAENPYLFNGDYVDRGSFSFEVVMTLMAWKLSDPMCMNLLRGNHESQNMNKMYGFEGEIKFKYDDKAMDLFSEVFNVLPLCAVIQNSVFVVHGGLTTQEGVTLDDIAAIPRGREIPQSGLMSDLLWADPQHLPGRSPSKRGVGFSFGPDITNAFLANNNLDLLVRSHEVKDEGYEIDHSGKCITIFSAPNYCDQMGNRGAFIRFKADMKPNFTQFTAVPHPDIPPMRYASMMSQFGL